MIRKILLGLLALLVVVVLVVAVGWIPREPLRRSVESALRTAFGPNSSVARVHVFPAGLRGELEGLVVDTDTYRLEVPRVEVGLRLQTLLGGGIRVRFLNIGKPLLRIKAPDPNAPKRPSARLPSMVVSGINLADATLIVELGGRNGMIEARGIRATGAIGESTLALDAPSLTWLREQEKTLDLGRATARLRLDPSLDTRAEELAYTRGRSKVTATGKLGVVTEPVPDLRFDALLHLPDFADLARTPDLRGALTVNGTLAGALDRLALAAKAKGQGVGVADMTADTLDATAAYKGGRSTATLDAWAFGGRVGGTGSLENDKTEGRAHFDGVVFEALPKSAALPPDLKGRVSGNLTWNGRVDGRIAVTSNLRSEATYGQPITATAELSGAVFPKEERLDLRFTTTAETQGSGSLRSGVVQAEGTAKGPWPPSVEGVAKIVASAAVGATTEPLEAETLFRSAASGSSVSIKGTFLGGSFEGAGRLADNRIEEGRLAATSIELRRVDPRIRGGARLNLVVAGPSSRPNVEGRIDITALGYREMELGEASVTLQGTSSQAHWTAAVPSLSLTGSGDVTTGKAGTLTGTLTADRTALAAFAPLAPRVQGLDGVATVIADVKVPLDAPAKADVTAKFTTLEVRTARLGPATADPFSLHYGNDEVELTGFRASAPGITAAVDGRFGVDSGRAISGTGHIQADLAAVEPKIENAGGTVDANLQFSGKASRPMVTGAINLAGISIDRPTKPSVKIADGTIHIENNVAVADNLRAELDGGVLVLAGRVPVPAFMASWRTDPKRVASGEVADLSLKWDGFDAGALLAKLRPTAETRLAAQFTGELRLRGGLAGLDEIDALLSSKPADIVVGDVDGRLDGFEVKVERGRVSTEGIQVDAAGATFRLSGSAGLKDRSLDFTGKGKLDLRVLSPLLADTGLTGTADVDARVTGTTAAPDARGNLKVTDATARFRVMTQALTDIQANAVFAGNEVRLEKATAILGGGTLDATGTVALSGRSVGAVDVKITGKEISLRYPEGLRSRIDADLKLTGKPGALLLAGDVRASRALYDRDFQTTAFLASVPVQESPAMRSIALNLNIISRSPLRIRNDTARLEATGRLNIRGDMQSPSPFGRFEVVTPGGELYLLGSRYTINRGTIVYNGIWDPQLDIEIQRRLRIRPTNTDQSTVSGEYTAIIDAKGTVTDITREVFQMALGAGSTGSTDTLRFSAEGPGDVDPTDVGYLALTGRRKNDIRGAGLVGEQTGSLLAGRLARSIQKGLPFENITIQPELVSRETDQPDARFTFGAPLADGVDLTYSLSLSTPEDKLIQLEGRPFRNFTATLKREYDLDRNENVVTVGGGQRFEFGGVQRRRRNRPRRDENVEITEVRVEGLTDPAMEKQARDKIKTKVGKKVNAWKVQDDGDRVREDFLEKGYLDVEVGADLDEAVASFNVRAGKRYVTRIDGMTKPPDLKEVLRKALYEEEALENGRTRILEDLFSRGHWRAAVKTAGTDDNGTRVLLFQVEPGPVLKLGEVTFPGATALSRDQLLDAAGGPGGLISTPQEARTAIRKKYEEIHYLHAQVLPPKVTEIAGRVDLEVPVEEGDRAYITQVLFEGSTRPESELLSLSQLRAGAPYDDAKALASVDALRNNYYRNGWATARVFASHEDRPEGIVFTFHVNEGKRLTVGSIQITGLNRVKESFVRSNIKLKPGDPLDPAKIGEMERRLLALTVFSRVTSKYTEDDPSVITIEVQERARYAAGYDIRYNSPEKLAPILDAEVRNLLGRGFSIGARYQRSSVIDQWRGTFFVPAFLWRGDLYTSVFRKQETNFGSGGADCNAQPQPLDCGVTRLQRGFSLQESVNVASRSTVLFGYRLSRSIITSEALIEPSTQNVAALTLSGLRDSRDDVLDAKRGSFLSLNLTFSPAIIGSDQNFMKGLAQAFFSVPVGKRTTWAQGYRLGLAHVFDGEPLLIDEGFTAGGGNTIRGLATDALQGTPESRFFGAQGLVVMNQEMRFRTDSGFGGVVFFDTGQVFDSVRKIDLDLRHSIGVGLRYASPFGLLRVDVATPLNRRRNPVDGSFLDKKYQYWFSLGQAF